MCITEKHPLIHYRKAHMYFEYKLTWNDIYKLFFIKFFNNVTIKVFHARLINILYIALYIHLCTAIYDKTNLQSFLQSTVTADVHSVEKNPSALNFLIPEPEVTCGTVAIVIRVVLLSPYLRICGVSVSSIHYNQSHHVCVNRRQQYICLI